ncbi:hypothetical protein E4U13_007065 [Claviceps humidiphila]|uniref:Uncharacterized protein n=1 Tax=Claviceps humidiphila TaxID=1294629 RepID=A0A9P7TRM6_9HYPO|nr:hypothetical protein E4U13_007065 [Claviceps humidiphila]
MALILYQQNESIFLRQRIQDLERQIQERDRELQQERERALQKERDRTLQQTEQKARILELVEETARIFEHNQEKQRQNKQKEQRAAEREWVLQQERDQALEQVQNKERALQQAEKTARLAQQRVVALRQEKDSALEQAREREMILQLEKDRALQEERDRALEQAEDRELQAMKRERALQYERDRALRQAQERDRCLELKMEGVLRLERAKAQIRERALQRERDVALQQERERALQQIQNAQRQAEERARALKKEIGRVSQLQLERDRALQLVQKYDPALQHSTLNEYVKECHDSLFSKLTLDPNATRSGDVSTTTIRGKWQPEKLLEWTDFLSDQRVMFDLVCDIIPPDLREFPRLTTVRDDGTKIAPIADEKALEKFIEDSIENPVKYIMGGLQSADDLSMICKGEVRVDFINHAEHTKPLKTKTTSSQPEEPVSTRFCICRDPSVAMASGTLLYVWEQRTPYDLTIQHLRSALQPTTTFGEVTEEVENSAAVQDGEEASQSSHSSAMAEKRAKRDVTQTYHNMMESCLEFGILTTGQAIVFLHVNWDDPRTLYYHIAEPALDVAKAPKRDAAFLSAVGQYVAFTSMALKKSRKPLQERRIRVFKTLSKWGMSSRLLSSEHRNVASSAKPLQDRGENRGNSQDQNSQDQPYPYCSQKCLLGLVQGGSLDLKCPNVRHHCRSDAGEAGAGHPNRHPVDHTEWLRLLQDQFKQSLDEGITYQSVVGARGAFFKVTLLAYGYTFVSKGTVAGHIKHLEHGTRVYERLKPIQGRYVPVFLGTIDLRTVDKDYWIYFETYVVHMMFMSWGGLLLDDDKMDQLGVLDEIAWADEGIEALDAVHEEGVLHCDVRWANILYNPDTDGIMLIDFERAELFDEAEPSDEESDKEGSMPMSTEQSQIWKKIWDRARKENYDAVFIIEDALEIKN